MNDALKTAVKESDPLGLSDIEEAKRDPAVAILFGRDPKTGPTIKEVAPKVVKKHNGVLDNFVEGSPFNEGRTPITEASNTRKDIFAKGDTVLIESMRHPVTKLPLTEAEKQTLKGGSPPLMLCSTRFRKRNSIKRECLASAKAILWCWQDFNKFPA